MSQPQRLIFEEAGNNYEVFIDPDRSIETIPTADDDLISKSPTRGGTMPTIPPEIRVKLEEVHHTIRGYTKYALGAFQNLAVAEVEEVTLKFCLKISNTAGLPMIASSKADTDFAIEVKCKFPKQEEQKP